MEVKPLRDLRTLSSYLRTWELDMAELVAQGGMSMSSPIGSADQFWFIRF